MNRVVVLLMMVFGCISCTENFAFVSILDMPKKIWSNDERVEFLFTPNDTLSQYRIDLIVRHHRDFHYNQLMLEVTTRTPKLLFWTDTVLLKLTDDEHRWKGRNFDTHYDFDVNYRRGVRFSNKGEHLIKIRYLEPKDSLCGIKALGLIIEKDGKE